MLLLNQAAGDRSAHAGLAAELAERGVSSLRMDLRGHGESTNLGSFAPGEPGATSLLEGTEEDVIAALGFLEQRTGIDPTRLGVVGASYSGEAMAVAGRRTGFRKSYVALSPGSFSSESARAIDGSGATWLFVRSRDEGVSWVHIAFDSVDAYSRSAEVWLVPGREHATDILAAQPGLDGRLADWLAAQLGS